MGSLRLLAVFISKLMPAKRERHFMNTDLREALGPCVALSEDEEDDEEGRRK